MNPYSIKKVANAVIYFLDNGVENFGKTKLMKLMFFADKYHAKKYMRTIFSDTYIKLPFGPVPSLTLGVIDSINEFEKDDFENYVDEFLKYIIVSEQYDGKYKKTTFTKKQAFDEDLFSISELEILKQIADEFKGHTAVQISEYSHTLDEYKYTNDNEVIDVTAMAPEHQEYFEMICKENRSIKELLSR
jgi:uncharacterized phage-associated protein